MRLKAHILLHHDGIETLGHDGACENADGDMGGRNLRQRMARRGDPAHRKYPSLLLIVRSVGEGIPIDGGVGMPRNRARRDDGRG